MLAEELLPDLLCVVAFYAVRVICESFAIGLEIPVCDYDAAMVWVGGDDFVCPGQDAISWNELK